MTLFREKLLVVQDEYLRVNPSSVDPEDDEDVDYSNDDIGENSEITPLGDDEIEQDDDNYLEDALHIGPGEDDEEMFDGDEDEDLLLDDEELLIEQDDDEIVDIKSIGGDDDDDDDDAEDFDENDDLFSDDDDDDFEDIENPDVIPVVPDTDEDDDTWTDDDDVDDTPRADSNREHGSTTEGVNPRFEIHHPERRTGRMTDHEPGVSGFNE